MEIGVFFVDNEVFGRYFGVYFWNEFGIGDCIYCLEVFGGQDF